MLMGKDKFSECFVKNLDKLDKECYNYIVRIHPLFFQEAFGKQRPRKPAVLPFVTTSPAAVVAFGGLHSAVEREPLSERLPTG